MQKKSIYIHIILSEVELGMNNFEIEHFLGIFMYI
jgi:hypothetical protein